MIASWLKTPQMTASVTESGWPITIVCMHDGSEWKPQYGVNEEGVKPIPGCFRLPEAAIEALDGLIEVKS